jgi:hypothetical protein
MVEFRGDPGGRRDALRLILVGIAQRARSAFQPDEIALMADLDPEGKSARHSAADECDRVHPRGTEGSVEYCSYHALMMQ